MNLEEIDRTLERLRGAAEAIRSNLLEIELDPNRQLLDSTPLEGETATRWGEASATLTQLWQWHALLDGLIDRAGKLRGSRSRLAAKRETQLSDMLSGASIELGGEHVPLQERQLLGGAQQWCTANELLQRSEMAFDQAKAVLGAVNDAWGDLLVRLAALRTVLEECTVLARELGEGEPQQLDRAHTRVGELSETLAKDPLSVQHEEVAVIERSMTAIREDLRRLDRVRVEIDALLADARWLLGELRRVVAQGSEAYAQARVKVTAVELPASLSVDDALERQLQDVEKIAHHGAWREARAVLEQWTGRARRLLEQAEHVVRENRAPIERRNELRGLLDACQAKALALGLIEDLELSGMFNEARESLYTAPTDLVKASELVNRYRQALAKTNMSQELAR
jgi:hypothetical protein